MHRILSVGFHFSKKKTAKKCSAALGPLTQGLCKEAENECVADWWWAVRLPGRCPTGCLIGGYFWEYKMLRPLMQNDWRRPISFHNWIPEKKNSMLVRTESKKSESFRDITAYFSDVTWLAVCLWSAKWRAAFKSEVVVFGQWISSVNIPHTSL